MCLTCAICHVDTQSLKFLLQGNGFSLPGHGEKLVSTKFGEEQKSFQGGVDAAPLAFAYFDENKFVGLAKSSLMNRNKKDKRQKNNKKKKGVLFSDYTFEYPLVPPKKGNIKWTNMGPTNQGVTMFRLVWKEKKVNKDLTKEENETQRLKELGDLLTAHDIDINDL